MSEKEIASRKTKPAEQTKLGREELDALAKQGLKLRRELEKRLAPMNTVTADDLQARSR